MRRESVIMAVTNDIYEFCVRQYDNTAEMAKDLGLSREHCQCMITRNTVYQKLNCRFIRVYLGKTNSTKGGKVMSEQTNVKVPSAEDLLDNYPMAEAKTVFSKLSNKVREKLVSEVWALYHRRVALTKGA